MIVTPMPRLSRIISEVWKPLAALFIWDVAVTSSISSSVDQV